MTPEQCIVKMKQASSTFYAMAQQCGHHQFLEFTGLLNEYIKLCEKEVEAGRDFRNHDLTPLSYHVGYVIEKLDCIFGEAFAIEAQRQGWEKNHG